MSSRPVPPRLAVVGGGIAGLAAAHRLTEAAAVDGQPLTLTLLEASDRLGGTIRSERADGFLLEGGPDSLISEKPWGLALAERLGLGPRLVGTDDRFRRTYVVRRGRLVPVPEGFLLLGPTRPWPVLASPIFSWRGKARMALDLVLPRGPARDDESLGHFVRRRLGREVLERVAQPLVGGIYTADPDRLSLAATMPRFLALEREHGSVIRGLRRSATGRERAASGARWSLFVTLAGGMQELTEALMARLPAGSVRLRSPVAAVVPAPDDAGRAAGEGDAAWRLLLQGGEVVPADGVVLAGEAPRMAGLVRTFDPELARLLGGIAYASSAAVTLAYSRAAVRHPLDAFGFIVPRIEGRPSLACTFASVKYPGRAPAGFVLLRVFLGGALRPDVLDLDDAALVREARDEVATLLGIAGEPVLTRVWRHPAAMPQYDVGHLGRIGAIETRLVPWPRLVLAGAAYRGVGIADCVRSGEAAADQLWSTVKGRTP
ncbi:MAG TPA: protoporphyrinogen oxidase [Methylomirabilota bacterium]|nr:protoporphyrinogen oxidase [Methylomirabilota bacterium]